MLKELTKVFGETVIYGVTGVASTLASVFLVPVYTRIFTPSDYGVSALLGTLFSIIVVIANLGMGSAIFRVYFMAKELLVRKKIAGTAFISQTLFPLAISVLCVLLAGQISLVLFGTKEHTFLVVLSSIALFFNAGIMVPLALLRAEGHPTNYVSINIVKLVSTIVVSIFLVVFLRSGLVGVFWGNLVGAAAGYVLGLFYTFKRISLSFSARWLVEMLNFGLPLVPAGLAVWILNSSDRYFLNYFAGTADVGIYNVGYRVGSILTLVTGALQLAYPRFLWSIYHEKPNPKDYYKKITTYFFLLTFSTAFLISVFAKEAIQILTGEGYHSAYTVVPLVAFSYVFYGLFQNFGSGNSLVNKTYLSAIATILAGSLNLVLNYFLIMRFGIMGAAFATFLSFLALALIQLFFSQRSYRIPFEFYRMFLVFVVGGFLVYVSSLVEFGLLLSLIVKSLLVLALPAFLYLIGFFEKREINKITKLWELAARAKFKPGAILEGIRQDMIT